MAQGSKVKAQIIFDESTTIIIFLKPGVAGGNPYPWCPRLASWYD
jgi:hypothetical protein